MVCPFIENIQVLESYTILIQYKSGDKRIFNASEYLDGEIFKPLQNEDYFRKATISFNTIEWPNGADFAPEFLWEKSLPVNE